MALTRKEIERSQRRELLLQAAARVFGRKPFDEASMQEVAAEAQIGMQGLYLSLIHISEPTRPY